MAGFIESLIEKKIDKSSKAYKFLASFLTRKKSPINPINGVIEIKLDSRWDSFPDPKGEGRSFFAGRSQDVQKLQNWIMHSDGGSVLIRGFRGIGKTAFVYEAISRSIVSINNYKNLLFIPVSFSGGLQKNGDLTEEAQILTRIIVSLKCEQNLINVDELFNAVISSQAEQESGESKGTTFIADIATKITPVSIVLILFLILQSINEKLLINLQNSKLFLLAILVPVTIYFGFEWYFKKYEKKITKILLNNPNYLSLGLKKALNIPELIPVFVVDELDKLFKSDDSQGQNGSQEINKIIRKLKYLFTLSKAKFIFIVHEEYPHWKELRSIGRPEESTYFNWDIFLTGLSLREIKEYFNMIKIDELEAEGEDFLDDFIHYISFESKRVFSEINQILRDFIEYKKGIPYLVIKDFRSSGSSGSNKMRLAVTEDILDSVLSQEEELETTLRQREFYHKTYLILRKAADDVTHNRFVAGNDLADKSINSLIDYYSNEKIGEQENPDFICILLPGEKESMKLKIRDFFVSMQKHAFVQGQNGEAKVFFDENNTNDTPINSSFTFEDIDATGRPTRALITRLPAESAEFKASVEIFKEILKNLKIGLDLDDDVRVATSVFGDDGVALLAAVSLGDKIKPEDYRTHNLDEIRKLKDENPDLFIILSTDPINRLKKWLSNQFPSSKTQDILVGKNKSIGFKIFVGNTIVFIFNRNYRGKLDEATQKELRKSLIIQLNDTKVNLNYNRGRYLSSRNVSVDLNTLKGAQEVLKIIKKKISKTYKQKGKNLLPGSVAPHFVSFVDIKEKAERSLITDIVFKMKSDSDYWRAGVLLGQNSTDDYEPLGDSGFPVFHIHKDAGETDLKLSAYSNGKHPADISSKNLGIGTEGIIKFHLALTPNNILRIFVNRKAVYNGIVDTQFLNKASIIAWGDGKPEYRGVEIIDYQYDEVY